MEEKIIKTNRIGEKLSIGQQLSKVIELEKNVKTNWIGEKGWKGTNWIEDKNIQTHLNWRNKI